MAFTCPFCYEKFSRDQIEFRCENFNTNACKEEDSKLATYLGQPLVLANRVIPNKTWSDFMNKRDWFKVIGKTMRTVVVPDEVKCDQCKTPSRKKVCPRCHNELPTYFHKADSHIISVIGARGSGKTHYITVLINELLKKGYKLDIATIPQDVGEDRSQVTSRRYQNEYKRPLLEQGDELTQTSISKDLNPLIYQITSGQQGGFGKTRALYLVFYDTAGENFQDSLELKKLANYVANSSGMIFLLDTFQVPEIKQKLRTKGITVRDLNIDFQGVFQRVYSLLENQGLVKLNAPSSVPIALTFSKIDEVIRHDLMEDDVEFSIRKNSKYLETGVYTPAELQEITHEMRSLLTQWGEAGFISDVEKKFSKTSYFGVSALGATPAGGKINEVRPHRVLDPLVWILDNIGFVLPKK